MKAKWAEIANYEVEHPAGPAPNFDLEISGACILDPSVEILVRRAFYDCAAVHLTGLVNGHSGVGVYLAFAERSDVGAGRWPQPHFVKAGDRSKISKEYRGYEFLVDPYVSFHLGPHLERDRCCLGAQDGILVGDFVEESERLIDCARTGRAAAAISCLFERTLRGWHRQSGASVRPLRDAKIQFPRKVPTARRERVCELGPSSRSLEELKADFERCGTTRVLFGPVHGDLHAGNVMVRGADAVMIDFLQCREGALLQDPASLEASLLVEGYGEDETAETIEEFRSSVASLYAADSVAVLPVHAKPRDRWSWFHSAIRQIRMHALHMERERGQYALILAAALLFKSSKDGAATEPEASRRALAYVFGEQMLLGASKMLLGESQKGWRHD